MFRGVTLSSGMRASVGAIEHVRLGEKVFFNVIGGGRPRGICEAGLWRLFQNSYGLDLSTQRGRLQSIGSDIAVKNTENTSSRRWEALLAPGRKRLDFTGRYTTGATSESSHQGRGGNFCLPHAISNQKN